MSEGASRAVITPVTNTHMSTENSCSDPNRMCHPTQQVPLHTAVSPAPVTEHLVNQTLHQWLRKRGEKQPQGNAAANTEQEQAIKGLFCKMQEAEKMISPGETNISGLQIGRKFRICLAFMLRGMLPEDTPKHNAISASPNLV